MSASNSTWTWTVIRTLGDDATHHLPCSPQGEPVVDHSIFGKSYSVVQHNFDRGWSAQPPPQVLEKARAYTQVQLGPNLYAVTSLLGCGLPQLFDNMAPSPPHRPQSSRPMVHPPQNPIRRPRILVRQQP